MEHRRVYALDVLKLFLAYVVAYFHGSMEFRPGPTLAVQIFFMISGFFLARKFYDSSFADHGAAYSAWNYTRDHVRSMYPHYLFSCGVLFLYLTARLCLDVARNPGTEMFRQLLLHLYNQIPDIFLLQSAYHWHESLNYPLWQMSALLIAGYFVYALLCRDEKLSRTILFPAAIFLGMSLMVGEENLFANRGIFYLPLVRAFYPMCMGVLTFYFTTTRGYARLRTHRRLFDGAALLCLVSLIYFAEYGNIFLLTGGLLIVNCYDPESLLNRLFDRPCFRWCGKLSYAIFLNHTLICRILWAQIVPRTSLPQWAIAVLYFVLLTGYSAVTTVLVEGWTKKHRQKSAAPGGRT